MTLDARLDRLREAMDGIGRKTLLMSMTDINARWEALRLIEELRAEDASRTNILWHTQSSRKVANRVVKQALMVLSHSSPYYLTL